jgi:uracil-DNA glycosylase
MTFAMPIIHSFPPAWPIESDWSDILSEEFESESFQALQKFVSEQRLFNTVYPLECDVFQAFRLSSFASTKVVILGQDPYHGSGQAHGLCFSVRERCQPPPSLKNIFKELVSDLGIAYPAHGNLTEWAKQGILLLNAVLTVQDGKANSHAKRGWERFTDAVVRKLGQQTENRIVFVLWGKPAEKKRSLIAEHHAQIVSAHPSPLSAHRGFFGSRPFSQVNEHLIAFGRSPINWSP